MGPITKNALPNLLLERRSPGAFPLILRLDRFDLLFVDGLFLLASSLLLATLLLSHQSHRSGGNRPVSAAAEDRAMNTWYWPQ
jgi:hypothetical protein